MTDSSINRKYLLKIGSIRVQPGLVLAPMAGVTGHPFRLLAREQGCRLLFSEMISARGLLHENNRNSSLLYFTSYERPIGLQLFGSDPSVMARAARRLEAYGADFIDINMGCPTRKITSNGDGGALMRRPDLCSEIFRAVTGAVNCPVTVKIRKGWSDGTTNAVDIASRAEEGGIAVITVHGRTVEQGYSGCADWEIIARVREKVGIPVIGNGDVDCYRAAESMFRLTGCDGVMVGRAARGNPWIFSEILAGLENRPLPGPPPVEEIVETALRHFRLIALQKGEAVAAREMRRHGAWYIRGLPGASTARQQLLRVEAYHEFKTVLCSFFTGSLALKND